MRAIWIEIPAGDLQRARRFYATVFGHEPADVLDDGTRAITLVPGEPTVSLNQTEGFVPDAVGPLPYFEVDGSVAAAVERAVAAGGAIVEPVTERAELGYFGLVLDSEGNHLFLHSSTA